MSRPNIVLIQVDQWRADCFSSENHPVVHTPFLDELASRGVFFRKAYAAVPTCIASRASLMTGLSQKTHGRVGYQDGVPWVYQTTLAGEFSRNGYQTQAIGKMHVYPERNRIGFDHVLLHDGYTHAGRNNPSFWKNDDYLPWLREKVNYTADYFDHGVNCNSYVARPWDKQEYLHPTNYVTTQAIDFLRRRDTTCPFLLYVSYHRPHPPYDPPTWAFEQYKDVKMPAPPIGDWCEQLAFLEKPHNPTSAYAKIPEAILQRAKAGYYGHMTHIDHQINRIVESLTEFDVAENTYILFCSDHGELMGDHHLFRKTFPFEGSARIPLILSTPPKDSKLKKNKKSETLIEMRDIMPTLLDLAGLPIPASIEGKSFLNSSLSDNDVNNHEYIHGEHVVSSTNSAHGIYTKHLKYIWLSEDGKEFLFDLENDPQELRNLSKDSNYTAKKNVLREYLIKELTGRKEGFVINNQLVLGKKTTTTIKR